MHDTTEKFKSIIFEIFLDTGCDPKPQRHSGGNNDVSYKMIDMESPPYFVNTSRSLIYTTVGRTVILECRVRNLGNRAVCTLVKVPCTRLNQDYNETKM